MLRWPKHFANTPAMVVLGMEPAMVSVFIRFLSSLLDGRDNVGLTVMGGVSRSGAGMSGAMEDIERKIGWRNLWETALALRPCHIARSGLQTLSRSWKRDEAVPIM